MIVKYEKKNNPIGKEFLKNKTLNTRLKYKKFVHSFCHFDVVDSYVSFSNKFFIHILFCIFVNLCSSFFNEKIFHFSYISIKLINLFISTKIFSNYETIAEYSFQR